MHAQEGLSVGVLLRGLQWIVECLEPTLRTTPRWASDLTILREIVSRLNSELEASGKLDDICRVDVRKAPPYGGPVSC
jgi:hypothetical protein